MQKYVLQSLHINMPRYPGSCDEQNYGAVRLSMYPLSFRYRHHPRWRQPAIQNREASLTGCEAVTTKGIKML